MVHYKDQPCSRLIIGSALLQRLQTKVRLLQEEAEETGGSF